MLRLTGVLASALLSVAGACASAPPPPAAPAAREAAPSWRMFRFGHGRGEVSLAPRYEVVVTDEGSLESRTNDPRAIVHLFIDIHPLEEIAPGAARPGACGAFLRARAEEKGLGVGEHGDKVVLIEQGVPDVVEGSVVKNTHFQICAGEALFVMTLAVREADAETPEVKQFFDAELEPIIASLRLR